jgi:preprotein translocase subunit SecE
MTVTAKKEIIQSVPKKQKEKEKQPKVSFKDSVVTYFKGVRSEWGKITWPERQQLIHETLIVIAVTTFFTILIYGIDKIIAFILGTISKLIPGN